MKDGTGFGACLRRRDSNGILQGLQKRYQLRLEARNEWVHNTSYERDKAFANSLQPVSSRIIV
jgi:hypothetical protein